MDTFFSKYGFFILEVLAGVVSIALICLVIYNTDILGSESSKTYEQSVAGTVAQPIESVKVDKTLAVVNEDSLKVKYDTLEDGTIVSKEEDGVIYGCIKLPLDSEFEWQDHVEAKDSKNKDLSDYVVVDGSVDTSTFGEYPVQFTLVYDGVNVTKQVIFLVGGH